MSTEATAEKKEDVQSTDNSFAKEVDSFLEEKKAEGELGNDVVSEKETDKEKEEKTNLPNEGETTQEEDSPAVSEKQDEPEGDEPEVSDELFERAIRAGLSRKHVEKIQDAEALEEIVTGMEARGSTEQQEEPTGEEDPGDINLDDIPDLDPELYDEDVVKTVSGLKNVAKQLQSKLKALEGSKSESWMDTQIKGLGDGVAKTLEESPEKRTALEEQINILRSGYKAAGKTISDEEVFSQASDIVLKDVVKTEQDREGRKKASQRSSSRTARPTGNNAKPTADPFDEIADHIDNKYSK